MHTAMVLEDGLLEGLDEQCLERVLAPKVDGVRALDAAVRADKLQYFVVYSSAATLIGNPGQGAYVLANAYLEGFVRERRARGEPGLAIGWGAISDVGVVARDRELAERIARTTGVTGIPARDALAFLGKLLARGADTSAVAVFSAVGRSAVSGSLTLLSSPAFAALAPSGRAGETTGADLASALAGKSDTQAREIVVATMISEIARILRVPEDGISPNRPLAEIGMDSLMALELRLGLEERLGIELPLLSLGEKSTARRRRQGPRGIAGRQCRRRARHEGRGARGYPRRRNAGQRQCCRAIVRPWWCWERLRGRSVRGRRLDDADLAANLARAGTMPRSSARSEREKPAPSLRYVLRDTARIRRDSSPARRG